MNDIEKQIEGVNDEESVDMNRLNSNNNDKKRIIMYVVGGFIALLLVGAIIYLVIINKDSDNNDNRNDKNNDVVEDNKDNKEDSAISYVACDGNTALLNVRNSVTGDIIDGLSCYQEVKIEEELEGNDACDKWYKISYKKRDNNYTGYACGTYIKKSNVKESTISKVKEIIDKANEYYEKTMVMPYCGNTTDVKDITFKNDDGSTFTGEYVKSEYKNIDEIKSYLATFASSSLFKTDLKLSDINNPKQYDDYYEIDGNLYCRNYSGKGWKSNYTGNYNIEITSSSDNKYLVNISYEYLNDDSFANLLIVALLFLKSTFDAPNINSFITTLLITSFFVIMSLYSFIFPASAVTLIITSFSPVFSSGILNSTVALLSLALISKSMFFPVVS